MLCKQSKLLMASTKGDTLEMWSIVLYYKSYCFREYWLVATKSTFDIYSMVAERESTRYHEQRGQPAFDIHGVLYVREECIQRWELLVRVILILYQPQKRNRPIRLATLIIFQKPST